MVEGRDRPAPDALRRRTLQSPASARSTLVAPPPVRIVLVDDHPAVRTGVRGVLRDEPGVDLVACAAAAEDAMRHVEHLRPDVVVTDYHLPGRDGIALARDLKARPAAPRVLIYSAFADDALVLAAHLAGVEGVVSKSATGDELCQAILAAARGDRVLPALDPEAARGLAARLDPEDLPVFGMLLHGVPADEVAHTLGMSGPWLEARRWAMLQRLAEPDVGSRSRRRADSIR